MLKLHWMPTFTGVNFCALNAAYARRVSSIVMSLLLAGCQAEQSTVPLPDDSLVSDFWSAAGVPHVVTDRHHWVWSGAAWTAQPALIRHQQSRRALRLPNNALIELTDGQLSLKPALVSQTAYNRSPMPWIDVAFRRPSPYFSAQRAYFPYPIEIFCLAVDGSLWLQVIDADNVIGAPRFLARLPAGATPLRLALAERRLLVLFHHDGALQLGRLSSGGIDPYPGSGRQWLGALVR